MEWHLNDLSLRGQFTTVDDLKAIIKDFLTLRINRPDLRDRIYCSRGLLARPVTPTQTLQAALADAHDRQFFSSAVRWLANSGPFWEDTRQNLEENLFYWNDEDVTDLGLGEAARRRLIAIDSTSFSFIEPGDEFDADVLGVTHGLLEAPFGTVNIPNYRTLGEIEAARTVELTGWENMLVLASAKTNLQMSPDLIRDLKPRPFHAGIAERLLQLLTILDNISAETQLNGELTETGLKLKQLYFVGKKALFSSEEPKDPKVFDFRDPDGEGTLNCAWHGKVKMGGQFRIHFEWPKPKGQLLSLIHISLRPRRTALKIVKIARNLMLSWRLKMKFKTFSA